jgi:hypothetical protein
MSKLGIADDGPGSECVLQEQSFIAPLVDSEGFSDCLKGAFQFSDWVQWLAGPDPKSGKEVANRGLPPFYQLSRKSLIVKWSERQDLNLRRLGPKPSALPG